MTTNRSIRGKQRGLLLALPSIFWLVVFFLAPLVFVLFASVMTRGTGGIPILPLTLASYERVFGLFAPVLWRSIWIAAITTLICLLIGYPVAFFISARKNPRIRQIALFLVLLPFWTNFLVRTYALQTILGREGIINSFLLGLGIIREPVALLFTPTAVLIGLVYGFLPFMILPVYASVERLDFRFVEAAYDLGANDWHAFWRVILPLTMPGVVAGCVLVFIPSIGAFVTPDLLGGTSGQMIGNFIQSQFSGRGNMPLASALSIVLMALVMFGVLVYMRYGEKDN